MTLKDGKMDISIRPATVQEPNGREWHLSFTLWGQETEQFRSIMLTHLPAWAKLFEEKNREYGAGQQSSGSALGVKGQFADIWRKIGKLKTGIWDDNESALTSESVDEILLDLIGHCFLTLWMRGQDAPVSGSVPFLERPDASEYSSESYEIAPGIWISTGDVVEFRQHLHKGGVYEVQGFDTQRAEGMVCLILPQVDKGEAATPIWTNPDWLEVVDQSKKESDPVKVDKGCPHTLTMDHVRKMTRDHLNRHHAGEALIW